MRSWGRHPMMGHSQLNVSSWYFFDGEAGNQMPTTPPSYEACGTTSPGWLATGHPNAGEPPSYGLVCFRDARTGANAERSCRHHLEVRVCACSFDNGVVTTYFYKLPEPPVCDMACVEPESCEFLISCHDATSPPMLQFSATVCGRRRADHACDHACRPCVCDHACRPCV